MKWIKTRHKIVFGLLRPAFKIFFRFKYRAKVKTIKAPKDGSIILCNHVTTLDPFLVALKFRGPVYYMASKDLFQHRFTGKLISYLVNPIPKEKSNKNDLSAIKACVKVSKENGTICIFPEGNRTFSGKLGNVDYSIVKLVKMLKKPLIICNIIGGYASDPRWADNSRKGKPDVVIKKTYTYDEYKDVDNDELYNIIVNSLSVDNFGSNVLYKGKKFAQSLERVFYICPVCNKMHTISTKDDIIKCSTCNLEVKLNKDMTFSADNENFKFKYIYEWYDYQIDYIKNKEYNDDDIIYEDEIEMYEPMLHKKKELIGKGKMSLYKDYFKFTLEDKTIEFKFDDIAFITCVGKKKLNFYYDNKTYQVFKDEKTNLIKYMHLFYIIKNRKEGVEDGFIGI